MAKCVHDLKELMEYLTNEKAALFGMSMGASIIYAYVKEFGCAGLDRVILGDMPPRLLDDDSPEHPWKWGLYRGKNSQSDLFANMARMFEDFEGYVLWHLEKCMPGAYGIEGLPAHFRQFVGTEQLPEEARAIFARGVVKGLDPLTTIAYAFSSIYEDYRDTLPAITVPAAVFYPNPGSIYQP
jgi:pimeloyl-ACP methyl ester carboxylesterase